jgi:spermidine/putrescine transport system permease protein
MTSRRARVCSWLLVAIVLTFLFVPIAIVVLFSFNSSPTTSLPFTGFSLKWYRKEFTDATFTDALKASAIVALTTGILITAIGTATAFALSRKRSRVLGILSGLIMIPVIVPGLFLAIALLSFYNQTDTQLSLKTIIAGHMLITLPLTVIIVGARLAELDRSVEEAARDCGATALQAFRKVTLPLIAPALFGALLIAVATSVDEVVIALFTTGEQPTVPVTIWLLLRRTVDPTINAVATTVLLTTVVATIVAQRFITTKAFTR